ncbi:hypothetical protein KSP40_PGU009120 [Platanthera guangdongensis]|uniref:Uncharacterized protein n=1 Tax=Platanthera guangdongensis TaxID=2320717 RepID=A0ABR2MTI3_9ASPA
MGRRLRFLRLRPQQGGKALPPLRFDLHLSPLVPMLHFQPPDGLTTRGWGAWVATRDILVHEIYLWTYKSAGEYMHPGRRKRDGESLDTMLVVGGLARVTCWVLCYDLDVLKSWIQAHSEPRRYCDGEIVNCLKNYG